MLLQRVPVPALRPFVALLWAADDTANPTPPRSSRERVLPTGATHVVFRLSDDPLKLYDGADGQSARVVGHAVVGGSRATYYVRDVSAPSRSVGALLHPGTTRLLFGGSAAELSGRHTRLDDIWGSDVRAARERMLELRTPERQLDLFEALLQIRLPRVRGLHPAIARALRTLPEAPSVRALVADSGYSHRRFIELFEDAVGLTPKRYARVLRFRRALERIARDGAPCLAELALEAGYVDQAHFNRDFREMTGISPTQYLAAAPLQPHHVPIVRPASNG
jgi:AraC-like DNA-binding protein